jgi:DNA-directed RNA polymerase subunit RPC12/RpoP
VILAQIADGAFLAQDTMPVTKATSFQCATCGAEYKLVRVEAKEVVLDQQIACRKCGDQLPGSEGHVVLKYFLVDRGRRGTCAR